MKRVMRISAAILTAAMLVGAVSGCSSTSSSSNSSAGTVSTGSGAASNTQTDGYAYEANTDPVTLSIYIDSPSSLWESWGSDPISPKITEYTGISFNCIAPVTDDDTKLTLLIASDGLPDIVTTYADSTAWADMVNNGMLADMEKLANQYAPKLKSELVDDEIWEYCRTDDGIVHYLLNSHRTENDIQWFEDNDYLVTTGQPVILMRQDYYSEIGSPTIKSAEELLSACEQIKAKHPDTIPFYAGDVITDGPADLRTYFGVGSYYVADDGTVSMSYRNPKYVDMYVWMNKMANKGLLTEDSFVDSGDEAASKTLSGAVASYSWTIGETGKVPADNKDTYYYPMQPWDSYSEVRTNTGYIQFAVSEKSENKDAAMRWIEFGNTELGVQTMCWGVEGKESDEWSGDVVNGPHFYFDKNGKATYFQGFQDARNADWSGVEKKSGLGYYQSFVTTNAVYTTQAEIVGSDLMTEMNEWYASKVSYNNGFIFDIPAGSDEYVIYQTIKTMIKEYNVLWTFAKDEAEVRSLYDEFIKKVENAGEATLNAWYTNAYQENISK